MDHKLPKLSTAGHAQVGHVSPIAPDARPAGHGPHLPREREGVRLAAADQSSNTIARTLDISPQTVDTHRRRLMRKLGRHSAAEVVCYALRSGLLVCAAGTGPWPCPLARVR